MSSPPVKYLRYFDFTTYASLNPEKPLPGASVDVEFNRLQDTTNQIIDRLALIQRDDGALSAVDLVVTGSFTAQDGDFLGNLHVHNNLQVDGALGVGSVVHFLSTLAVDGLTSLAGLNTSGLATLASLLVQGAATFSNKITVTQASDFLSDLTVHNNLSVLGAMSVGSAASFGSTVAMAGKLTISAGGLDITGSTVFHGPVTFPGGIIPPASSINTAALQDGCVTEPKLAALSVSTRVLQDGSVTSAKLAPGAVLPIDIPDNSITSVKIADGTIDPVDLSPSTYAIMTAAGNPRGAWATGVNYATKDAVVNGNGVFVCIIAHLSGVFATDLAAGKWYQTGTIYDQSLNTTNNVKFAKLTVVTAAAVNPELDFYNTTAGGWALFSQAGAFHLATLNAAGVWQANWLDFSAAGAAVFHGHVATGDTLEVQNAGSAVNEVLIQHSGADGYIRTQAGNLYLGAGGANVCALTANGLGFVPLTNSAVNLGGGSQRWADVWSVNGDFSGTLAAGNINAGVVNCNMVSANFLKLGALSIHASQQHTSVPNNTVKPFFTITCSGSSYTSVRLFVSAHVSDQQAAYSVQYMDVIFRMRISGGTDYSDFVVLNNSKWSLNTGVLDLNFGVTYVLSGGVVTIRVQPTLTGAQVPPFNITDIYAEAHALGPDAASLAVV